MVKKKSESFIEEMNKLHPAINFTADWFKTSINFLDMLVKLREGIIETDLCHVCK